MSIAMKYCLLSGQHFTATVVKYGPSAEHIFVVNVIKLCPPRKMKLNIICYLFEFELYMYYNYSKRYRYEDKNGMSANETIFMSQLSQVRN